MQKGDGAGGAGNVGTDIDALYNRWITYEFFYFSHRATIAHIPQLQEEPHTAAKRNKHKIRIENAVYMAHREGTESREHGRLQGFKQT
jgi:hypothetical protein